MITEKLSEEEELPKTWVPRVVTGGKGPPDDPNNPDWLTSLPVKTTVWIQGKKDQGFPLGQATVVFKGQRGVVIAIDGKVVPVDPVRFCRDYKLYEVIQTSKEAEEEAIANAQVTYDNLTLPK